MVDLTSKEFDVAGAVEEGATLHLTHPVTGELLYDGDQPVTITLRGLESASVRAVAASQAKKEARGVKISDEAKGVQMMVAATLGWSGLDRDGEPLEFTPDNVKWLFAENDWIGQQAIEFMKDRANFFTE